MRRRAANRRRQHLRVRVRQVMIVVFFLSALGLLAGGAFAMLPLPPTTLPEASRVYDHRGRLIDQLFQERRTPVQLDDVPLHLQQAVLAVEDERFYRHFGFDVIAFGRALARNVATGRIVEGGSTISQQLAKNLFLGPEQTLRRKLLELAMTLRLEHNLSKTAILEQYLNTIYFGHGAYGVEEAAQTYFGRSVDTLTLAESAMLAGLIKTPERLSPHRNLEQARARQRTVLQRMVELDVISDAAARSAAVETIKLANQPRPGLRAPYFLQFVLDEIEELLPGSSGLLYSNGLRIITTLDVDHQLAAERAMTALPTGTPDASGILQPQAAVVAVDPVTGGVRAMVGGRDFSQTQFNRAVQAKRQPGSAFKPFVYLAAIDQGYLPTARMMCEPVSFPTGRAGETYTPTDHGSRPYHYRPLSMREALAVSDNVVAVRWIDEVGPTTVAQYARSLGITSSLQPHLSLALGTSEVTPLEMAVAYAALANGGYRVAPHAVLEIRTADGEVIYQRREEPVRVLRPEVAYIVTDLLTSVLGPGGTAAWIGRALDRPAAAKTGTSEGTLDAWFVGYTPDLVCSVYVGWDGPRRSLPGTGTSVAGPVWLEFMSSALTGVQPARFTRPSRVTSVQVCSETGLLAGPTCPLADEVFASPLLPYVTCPVRHDQLPFPDDGLWPFTDDDHESEADSHHDCP